MENISHLRDFSYTKWLFPVKEHSNCFRRSFPEQIMASLHTTSTNSYHSSSNSLDKFLQAWEHTLGRLLAPGPPNLLFHCTPQAPGSLILPTHTPAQSSTWIQNDNVMAANFII